MSTFGTLFRVTTLVFALYPPSRRVIVLTLSWQLRWIALQIRGMHCRWCSSRYGAYRSRHTTSDDTASTRPKCHHNTCECSLFVFVFVISNLWNRETRKMRYKYNPALSMVWLLGHQSECLSKMRINGRTTTVRWTCTHDLVMLTGPTCKSMVWRHQAAVVEVVLGKQ